MKTMAIIRRLALGAVLLLSPALLISCGNANGGEQVATDHAGPIGPTNPNAYYFDFTVTPHTVTSGSNVLAKVRVWDKNGNTASGVTAILSGDGGDPKDSIITTGADGVGGWISKVSVPADSYLYFTVSIDDKSLTVPIHVTPGTISAFTGTDG